MTNGGLKTNVPKEYIVYYIQILIKQKYLKNALFAPL